MNKQEDQKIEELNYKLGQVEGEVSGLRDRLNQFIDNEFSHLLEQVNYLRGRLDWILWILILGTLVTILINLAFK